MNVVLLGAPGAGKGTLAKYLEQRYGMVQVASGDLFRENLKNQTDLGRQAQAYMQKGELVPDEITISMIKRRLAQIGRGRDVMLDGFPRTVAQAEALTSTLALIGQRVDCVLYLKVTEEELLHRLVGRWICRSCQQPYNAESRKPKLTGKCDHCKGELYQREDDQPEAARTRLAVFHAQTEPLIAYYHRTGELLELNALMPIEIVASHAVNALNLETVAVAA